MRCPGWGFGKLPDRTEVPGCDTVFAVYPEWRKTWAKLTPQEVFTQTPGSPARICITGGEPLMQPKDEMERYVRLLIRAGLVIDLFTNGTRPLPSWGAESVVTVVMDWKMPGSGEYGKFDVSNLRRLGAKDAIKFVVDGREDFETALACAPIVKENCNAQLYFGAVWGKLAEGELAQWVTSEYPTGRLNVQLHKLMWNPDERRR